MLLIKVADYDVFPSLFLHFLRQFKLFSVPLDTSDIWSNSRPKSVGHTQKVSEFPAVPTIFVITGCMFKSNTHFRASSTCYICNSFSESNNRVQVFCTRSMFVLLTSERKNVISISKPALTLKSGYSWNCTFL